MCTFSSLHLAFEKAHHVKMTRAIVGAHWKPVRPLKTQQHYCHEQGMVTGLGFCEFSQIIPPLETTESAHLTVAEPVSIKSVNYFITRDYKLKMQVREVERKSESFYECSTVEVTS